MDELQLDFVLAPGTLTDNFVFAVVAKNELLSIKDSRWDLVNLLSFYIEIYSRSLLDIH